MSGGYRYQKTKSEEPEKAAETYVLRGDRPVCEACHGTGVNPVAKGTACAECQGDGRIGQVAPAPEPEAPQAP